MIAPCVQITFPIHPETGAGHSEDLERFLECLRYANAINRCDRENGTVDTIRIIAPRHIGRKEIDGWAQRNAARMVTFGYSATVVLCEV